ncbi:MAG: hypothetical protein ACYCY2_00010 [Acidithiobacillus ferriphilus]
MNRFHCKAANRQQNLNGRFGRQPDMSRGQSESPKRVDIGQSLGTTSKSFNLPIFNVRLKNSAELLPLATARPD